MKTEHMLVTYSATTLYQHSVDGATVYCQHRLQQAHLSQQWHSERGAGVRAAPGGTCQVCQRMANGRKIV